MPTNIHDISLTLMSKHNDFNVSNDVIFYFGIYEKHHDYIIKDKTLFIENNNTFIQY
jgi:hypothetical protein